MSTRIKIIYITIFSSLCIILLYSITGGESYQDYETRINKDRADKDRFFHYNNGSPLTKEQKKGFKQLEYFKPNLEYKIKARVTKLQNQNMVTIPTSDNKEAQYYRYGYLSFTLNDSTYNLLLLLDSKAEGKLILAFADKTSAIDTYGGGRYLDLEISENKFIDIDFNKAYNPYCAYNATYSCVLPPKENILPISINAGEKYSKLK